MILDRITDAVRRRAGERARKIPTSELEKIIEKQAPARDFRAAITRSNHLNVIAEIKRASPSAGLIRPGIDPAETALDYEEAGAAALSVLTESDFFKGGPEDLRAAREAIKIPVLQKDFILDEYQVLEARAIGADAVLLITAVLDTKQVSRLRALAEKLGMAALVEVHDERELEAALECGAQIIGVNNRNLKTMETDIANTQNLLPFIPGDRVIVSESGLRTRNQLLSLAGDGVDAFLVGEHLLNDPDPGTALRELLGT